MLTIFPTDSVAISMTATIWVGVLIVVFCHLRFGWTMSGLVVPGYLVPLLIARPLSAAVIVFEAAVTYGIVRSLSDGTGERGAWSSFFGRDRFFIIVLVSVLVRVVADGWLLPAAGNYLAAYYGLTADCRNDLHSYGLLIVALIANYFWTPGLRRGWLPFMAVVAATYGIVNYGLAGFTNLNLESLHFMYEDIASSLLASPKAYIILVTAGYLASRFKLRYGWDYSGILIPALLALLWHDPWKLASTVVEATGILAVGAVIVQRLASRGVVITGPRKLVLFFTLCFLYRLVVAHVSVHYWPQRPATDAYGFGYLLTTLLALSAHDKGIPVRVLRATLQTSMLGAVTGTLIGFALLHIPDPVPFVAPSPLPVRPTPYNTLHDTSAAEVLVEAKIELYRQHLGTRSVQPSAHELAVFTAAVQQILAWRSSDDEAVLNEASAKLATIAYDLTLLDDRYAYVHERRPGRGRGIYLIDLQSRQGLLVEVPAPLAEWSTLEAGGCLFRELHGRALAIAGMDTGSRNARTPTVLAWRRSLFNAFHRLLGRRNSLQVRGYSRDTRSLSSPAPGGNAADSLHNTLWIKRSLPRSLPLPDLKRQLQHCDLVWATTPLVNVVRDDSMAGFSELWLTRDARRRLRTRWLQIASAPVQDTTIVQVHTHLSTWLTAVKRGIARRATDLYVPATVEEMLYLDHEVVDPLLRWIARQRATRASSSSAAGELLPLDQAAAALGYRVAVIETPNAGPSYVALVEMEPRKRYWGTYLFRLGVAQPYVVHVPRPLFERNAFEIGCELFEQTRATGLLIAGAHPYANRDGSSNIMRFSNRTNALNLVHQVMIRQSGASPLMVIQTRAVRATIDTDIVISSSNGTMVPTHASALLQRLVTQLESEGLKTRMADGSRGTADYEAGLPAPTCQVDQGENKEMVTLWVSPALRGKYRSQESHRRLASACAAAGIPLECADLYSRLRSIGACAAPSDLPAALRRDILAFLDNLDVVRLSILTVHWHDYRFTSLLDVTSGQQFLLIARANGKVSDVVNVSGWVGPADRYGVMNGLEPTKLSAFVHSRAAWLRIRSGSRTTRAASAVGKTWRDVAAERPAWPRRAPAATAVSASIEPPDGTR